MSSFSFLKSVMNSSKKSAETDKDDVETTGELDIGNLHHIGARESQQDSFGVSDIFDEKLCLEKGVLAVVADGMGGMENGAEVSAMVTSCFLEAFSTIPATAYPSYELARLTAQAHKKICAYLASNNSIKGGSTLVSVIIRDGKLYFVSVGDSRIYLIRGGEVLQLNREHTYGVDLDQKAIRGEISFADANLDNQRKSLTSYLGTEDIMQVDILQEAIRLVSGDKILLMSDGVFGALNNEEIVNICVHQPIEVATRMEEEILNKKNAGQDNFTAIIIEYK